MTYKVGPFTIRRIKWSGFLEISLTAFNDCAFGWEYGWDDCMASREPWLQIRVGKLMVLLFEKWESGFEIRLMGFWWIK